MCGIVGIFNYGKKGLVEKEILIRMRDTMVHRGPDSAGIWISSDRRVGFGHRRLSIIDLSESANQPMCNEDGTVWIVFNGEIYNHKEIRPELEAKGHRFKTDHSDTEVIIHAFEEWGQDCVHRFRGMFAFSIWDDRKKELSLFRDHIGIKPLYYTFQNGKFIFASEIKAIVTHPEVLRSVDEEAFYHYLSFLTTPAPHTLFRGIMKIPCSCYGKVKEDGHIEIHRYWDVLDYTSPLLHLTEEKAAAYILEELRIAVQYRKVSDVPVGVFLSGGIDSSVNALLFSEGEEKPVKTFSIGYDKDYRSYKNEFEYARSIAALIGAEHFERQITIEDFIDFLPKLIYYQDEPIADPVCVPLYYLCKLAREKGVIVCQVGEGNDELFCGYPGWKIFLKLQKFSNFPLADSFMKIGLAFLRLMGQKQTFPFEKLRRGVSREPFFWGGAEAFTENEKGQLLSYRLNKQFHNYSSFEAIQPIWERFNKKAWEKTSLNWMTYLDLQIRLPELLLMRVDKMSMATSLEARVPFLDRRFVELALSISESIKMKNGKLKYIFKKAVNSFVPEEILNRPKQGFNVPVYEWLFSLKGNFAKEKIMAFIRRTDFFQPAYVERLFRSGARLKIWYILNFVLWHEQWLEGKGYNAQKV
jgi:asparagine synthase (glutamine-hydrolysing)